jgi:hypothetical protein
MSLLVSNINVFWHWMHFQSKVSVLHNLQKRLGELDTRRFIRIQKTPQRCKEYLKGIYKGCPWYLYIGYTICKVWIKQYFCKRYNVSSLSLICVSFMWHLSFLLKRKKKEYIQNWKEKHKIHYTISICYYDSIIIQNNIQIII